LELRAFGNYEIGGRPYLGSPQQGGFDRLDVAAAELRRCTLDTRPRRRVFKRNRLPCTELKFRNSLSNHVNPINNLLPRISLQSTKWRVDNRMFAYSHYFKVNRSELFGSFTELDDYHDGSY